MECSTKGNIDITGCRVSLYPMTDNFSEVILGSFDKVDTRAVWSQTDLFSTLYRGEQESVIDATQALFMSAYQSDVHMVTELTFSKGCPGDSDADRYINGKKEKPNQEELPDDFPVKCKYSFYSFGEKDYMEEIATIVEMASEMGLNPQSAHYVTLLEGTASQLFVYFERALQYAHEHLNHYVLEATVSVNSPSEK
ncbi:YkoF family thiamine/hydroxymethylpyrimidine-binding protein [Lactococcus nasutitermitis]|uniref:YkoF family thiamine/hydroxymethylpyrimidine-binding protein n=1 Tax=Lactococcus nasutitermitis TaxID=1652957 RepID=A0ABV9JDE6_9LACT|nr:YkoF family thiamine/hydroxymethylpyrimidine-binding protein [Lactococcus nasutitermitis]